MFIKQSYARSSLLTIRHSILLIAFLFLLSPLPSHAVDIRGRVQVNTNYNPGWAPRPYANVALITFDQFNQPYIISSYQTGSDGMYFFYNLRPGPYRVVVNNGPSMDFYLNNVAYFDVAPIWVP